MNSETRWSILACSTVPDAGGDRVGVFPTLLDWAAPETKLPDVQVSILFNPSPSEFRNAVTANRPNFIYFYGTSREQDDKPTSTLGPFWFRGTEAQDEEMLLAALEDARVEVAFVDATVSPHFGPALHHRGTPHVVVWPASSPIPTSVASYFAAAFLALLVNSGATPAEAFATAIHGAQANCCCSSRTGSSSGGGGGGGSAGGADEGKGVGSDADGGSGPAGTNTFLPLPALVSAVRPGLPDSSSIPPFVVSGLSLEPSRLPSFPGWSDVRLLAPRAELRLLLVGNSSLIESTRLSFLGEALRALLVMEVRGLKLISHTPLDKQPRALPPTCQALHCHYTTCSGMHGSVVLGAPPSVSEHDGLVQHALRMTLVADSVSLQFRLPPPGLSLPAPRRSRAVAQGLPVVDTVVLTSVWAVEVLRSLCKEPKFRSLAALGVAAVGNLAEGSFVTADVRRLEVLIAGSWSAAVAASRTSLPPLRITASESRQVNLDNTSESRQPTAAVAGIADSLTSPTGVPLPPPGGAVMDLMTAAASGGAYFGNDALMGYALNGHLQNLFVDGDVGGGGDADDTAAARVAALPNSFDGGGSRDGPLAFGPSSTWAAATADGVMGLFNCAAAMEASLEGCSNGHVGDTGNGFPGSGRPTDPLSEKRPHVPCPGDLPGYICRRPPLSVCSESQFYDDLVEFLTVLRGKTVERLRFPEAVLNGVSLDLFSLYREVVTRGGFRVGNGINWKGQVFPRMRNWTETNKQTGVGNALKRHYQNYLWEYEVAHPEDVTTDRCVLCNGGDGVASDWVCCDSCENWAHFSCDRRPNIGAFKDYAQGQGRVYVCPSCAREQEAGAVVKRQRTA